MRTQMVKKKIIPFLGLIGWSCHFFSFCLDTSKKKKKNLWMITCVLWQISTSMTIQIDKHLWLFSCSSLYDLISSRLVGPDCIDANMGTSSLKLLELMSLLLLSMLRSNVNYFCGRTFLPTRFDPFQKSVLSNVKTQQILLQVFLIVTQIKDYFQQA